MRIRLARVTDADGVARVHVESWRTTYPGLVPEEYLARLSCERQTHFWVGALDERRSGQRVWVAEEEGGEIVGFATAGPERSRDPVYGGELYGIYLVQRVQRQGLGRQLVREAARWLDERGLGAMLVWVLADNPSRRFYEALGGEFVRQQVITIGGSELVEVAYGWLSLEPLLGHLEQSVEGGG